MSAGQPPNDDAPRDPTVVRPRQKPGNSTPAAETINSASDSGNFDTRFQDSPRSKTVLRPRTPAPAAPPEPTLLPTTTAPPIPRSAPLREPAPAYSQRSAPMLEPLPTLAAVLNGGGNPLVQSAVTLLILCSAVREAVQAPETTELRERIVAAVQQFESQAKAANVPTETVATARYALCSFIDESIMNTPWGEQTLWSEKTALMMFHRETRGGEKVFQILDRARKDFQKHHDLIELIYVCIALGFSGKYAVEHGGDRRLRELQADLHAQLSESRIGEQGLSPHWRGVPDTRGAFSRFLPPWMAGLICFALFIVTLIGFHLALSQVSAPVEDRLAAIGNDLPLLPPYALPIVAAANVLTLKKLLAKEEAAGLLAVDDYADRSVVRLNGDNFTSGSASPTSNLIATLKMVSAALNQLPGRVLVVGHTDDQPIRSLNFASNRALSLARAEAAAGALRIGMSAASRLEVSGAGSDQPFATPANVPANRARNRRVEITLLNG